MSDDLNEWAQTATSSVDTIAPIIEAAVVASESPDVPTTVKLEAKALLKAFAAHAMSLSSAVNNTVANIESLRYDALHRYPPGHSGHEAARHYCKGLADCLRLCGDMKAANAKFHDWIKALVKADEAERVARGGAR